MKLIFLTISVILAFPLVKCRELRSDSLSNILVEKILKPSPFLSSPTKGLPSPSLASDPSYASQQPSLTVTQMSHDLRWVNQSSSSLEASDDSSNAHPTTVPQPLFGAGELAFVQLMKLGSTQSTNPTNAPSSLSVDQLSQREDTVVSENLNYSWNSSSIAIFAVAGSFIAFISLTACGIGHDYNDEHSTGTTGITLCPSTDEEITYQPSNPLSPSPYHCSSNARDEVVIEMEYDANISCSVISAKLFEDVVEADYDDNRVEVVTETENDENISWGVVSAQLFEDEAEYYENIPCSFISAQSASLSRTLAPVPEEASVDYELDEMSEFSV